MSGCSIRAVFFSTPTLILMDKNTELKLNDYLKGIVLNLPESPGIYQYLNDEGTIIYVGKAKNLKRRVSSYFNRDHGPGKTRVLVSKIADIRYIVVNTEEDALLRSLRANGRGVSDKYDNQRIGMNSRLDTLQAAVLLPKLRALRTYELDALNAAAAAYAQALDGCVETPRVPDGYQSSWAQYTVLLENRARRDGAQRFLRERGIPSMIYYPRCIHQQTAYADRQFDDALYPGALAACDRVLSLPMHPYLTGEDIGRVAEALRQYCLAGRD